MLHISCAVRSVFSQFGEFFLHASALILPVKFATEDVTNYYNVMDIRFRASVLLNYEVILLSMLSLFTYW